MECLWRSGCEILAMPPAVRQIVYVDTNVVFEAVETGCWAAILQHFDVHTVTEVRRETQAGDRKMKSYVVVDTAQFDANVQVNEVSPTQLAKAQLRAPLLASIDEGERDLLAYVATQSPGAWLLTTGDRAAVRAACALGLGDRLRSLEELAGACGLRPQFHTWHTKTWLSGVRTTYLLDAI